MVLSSNQLVQIEIEGIESVDDEIIQSIDYSFGTTLNPLYSTPNRVRAIAGSYIQEISDEMLIYLIHLFSIEATNLSICKVEDYEKWNYYAGLWVAHNTAMDAIVNSNTYIGNAGQKVYKKLGDFSISKDTSGSNSSPAQTMINKLACEILNLTVSVKFCREPLTSCDKGMSDQDLRNALAAQLVSKGSDLARPLFGRTFESVGRHPQMTGFVRILDRYRLTNIAPRLYNHEYVYNDNNGRYI